MTPSSRRRGDRRRVEAGLAQHRIVVLAHARRRAVRQGDAVDPDRVGDHSRAATVAVVEVEHAVALVHERVLERLGDVEHRRDRHLAREALDPGRGRCLHQRVVEEAGDAVAVLEALREDGELGVGDPLRMAELLREQRPELLLVAHDEDPAVLGAVELARHQARVAAARRAAGHRAAVQVPGAGVVEVVHRDVEERRVDVHADAGLARLDDAGEQAERRRQAGHQVDDRQPVARRRAVGLAGHASCGRPRPASGSRSRARRGASRCGRRRTGGRRRCAGWRPSSAA